MNDTIQFLIRNGYTLLFFWILFEQLGLPIEQLDEEHHKIPRDRDIVLYCT